jgi:hypothetical protein
MNPALQREPEAMRAHESKIRGQNKEKMYIT